eukprot:CAMPEP_0168169674 /NCGR_PEP_ID=MMETSP0139_2-20121125/3764_1 /TAXON_ID=44445 /ORGANISM="Pseudo-nitzschia australis, Strain 10249 10 AB" /LENGTH=137 /DNA_ID=CAMNT_0008087109 /DNA_START=62 /DNA_END=478 /DNA_ORIENTATION=+
MVVNFIPPMTTTRWNGTEDRCELRCVAAGPCRGPRSARARHPSQTRFASSPMQRSSSMRQSFAISFPPLPDDGPVPGMFGGQTQTPVSGVFRAMSTLATGNVHNEFAETDPAPVSGATDAVHPAAHNAVTPDSRTYL